MNRFMAVSWAGLAVVAGCADGRSHPELMADAAADVEAVRLEHAMARYDTARTLSPADAEAHRRYATLANYFSLYGESARAWERVLELEPEDPVAWDGYIRALRWACSVESNRRYGEKLLRVLPEALRHGSRRPGIYSNAEAVAGDLGELEAYGAILSELERWRPGDHVLLHRLESLRVRHANLEAGNRSRSVRDSIGAALGALAMRREGDSAIEAPVLYRLAAGYEMLDREKEADSWLGRLEAVPDRGVLADELRHRNLSMGFGDRLFGSSADASPQAAVQIVDEGLKAADLGVRGVWVKRRHMAVLEQVLAPLDSDRSVRQALNGTVHVSAEPPGPTLDAEAAGQLFDAVVEVIRWQNGRQLAALNSLLYFGIRPRAVLDEAIAVEEALREDRPGYLAAAYRGDKRDREQQKAIDLARIAQARALTQLGEIEAAGRLFEELADRSRGSATLGEYGRHLLRTDQAAEALDPLVEAIAFGGFGFRTLAEEAAAAAGWHPGTIDERLASRRPAVEKEMERRELGERLQREAPDFSIEDQSGFEWRLSDLAGKIVVLKFWATWCGPCLAEFPHFVELLKTYEDDEDVVFLTVATAGSPREEVADLLQEHGYTFPVLLDEQGLALDFEIHGYPTTLYLDRSGVIQFKGDGFRESGYAAAAALRIDALRSP